MKLDCFVYDGWTPRLRPARQHRQWMDDSPEKFAYRCLPLAMANAHGWELLSPCGFEAEWNGGPLAGDVTVSPDAGTQPHDAPVALFGQATVTFHVAGLFRTEPGWNLWLGGPPNAAKDGIAPLSGLIETDWSPYSFTMNWQFTRPRHRIRFEENEPIAHFFPVPRAGVEAMEPRLLPIADAPELKAQFEDWSRSRNAFHEKMREMPDLAPADKWQKLYYRGVNPDGSAGTDDHQTKIRPGGFAAQNGACPWSGNGRGDKA